MITDIKQGAYGIEGKLYSKIFNIEIDVIIEDNVDIEYALKCSEHFNSMTDKMLDTICRGAKAYCLDFMEEVGGDFYGEMKISITPETPPLEMLKCFRPTVFIVKKNKDENKIGYQLECRSDWEIEHSMEIDILDEKVVYLGIFSFYSPWREYNDIEWNYINQI